jgi:hypothetical protein
MMDNSEFDLGNGAAQAAPDTLANLNASLEEAVALELMCEQMEEDLKAAKKTLQAMKTGRIPDLMAEMQMEECVHNGWRVKIADFVSGSLPADPDKRARAIIWLEQNEGGGLIKTEVSIEFGKSQHDEAIEIAEQLKAEGYAPKVDSGVHSATLQAFARERIKNGDSIDTEVLGLYTGKVAKFGKVKK